MKGQVSGKIMDEDGLPLIGASVLVKNTSNGAATNIHGDFIIQNTPDVFTLTISYVGYKTKEIASKRKASIQVTLETETLEVEEVVIKSNVNPAIPIIRKAIERRKELFSIPDYFRTTAYTKGAIIVAGGYERLKMFGMVDTTEIRDSVGNIYLYLAETLTEYTKIGKEASEKIISSRRSGDTRGLAMNFIQIFNVNFMDNYIELNKKAINPIGNLAFQYYNYELMGSYFEGLQKYYKIRVIPKRSEEAVFTGFIYIADDHFTLKQVDLFTRGPNVGMELIDTMTIQQTFLRLNDFEKWMPLTQSIQFNASFFGIKLEGFFNGIYNQYEPLDPNNNPLKKNVIIEFDKLASKQTEAYWDSLRPTPLTFSEQNDYALRDAKALLESSPAFIDSMDQVQNRFKPTKLLSGYTYRNTLKGYRFNGPKLIAAIRFDAVQGFSVHPEFQFVRQKKDQYQRFFVNVTPGYGFSENKLRYVFATGYRGGHNHKFSILLNGGHTLSDYNNRQPMEPLDVSLSALWAKRNYSRYYDHRFVKLTGMYQITTGMRSSLSFSAGQRQLLNNHSNFSLRRKERQYQPNFPASWELEDIYNKAHNAYISALNISWRPGNKLIKLPETISEIPSNWPIFEIVTTNGLALDNKSTSFHRLDANIHDIRLSLGAFGQIRSNIYSGLFVGKKPTYKHDFAHFGGHLAYLKNTNKYLTSFKYLSFYQYATDDKYLNWFAEYDMEGFLFKKLPLLKKSGFEEILSINGLITPEAGTILELGAGIDRIGFGPFRFFRFDYFWTFRNGKPENNSFVVGTNLAAILSAIAN